MMIILNSGIFGKNVRYLRRKRKMSMFHLARQLELSPWQLYRIEQGRTLELEDLLMKWICSALSEDMQTMIYEKLYE